MSRVLEHLESAETDFLFFSQTVCLYYSSTYYSTTPACA